MIEIAPVAVVFIMFGGLVLASLTGHPIAFIMMAMGTVLTFLTVGMPGTYLLIGRTFDQITSGTLVAIPLFVLMASFLDRSGIAEDLFTSIMYMFGRLRGGLGLAVVILSVIFAASTGIVGAAVVGISMIAMPVMMKRGYDKSLSTGLICAGGSLGILIPPSIMLVMMADQSGQSVGVLFAGAFMPGFLLGALYFVYVLVYAKLKPNAAPALPTEELMSITPKEKFSMFLKSFVPPVILIAGVLGSIWMGVATPTEAAGIGTMITFLMMALKKRFNYAALKEILISSVKTNAMVMATMIGATVFTGAFMRMGADVVVRNFILSFQDYGKWAVFLVMMFFVFIMGFFIDWIGIIFITFPIYLPIANLLGFDIVWFIIVIAVNLQMSFITPPFGYALFYIQKTAPKGVTLADIYRGIIRFIILQMFGLALCVIFPQIVLWLPSLVRP
ncbi:MAG: TRAP transporter large permease subunit [Bacillota bacterium]|nr:TRAP transporter large permease subunit [Bacillota bacterium]